ncbi:MAG: hypothetical protein AB8H86_31655 [Polyangiales bacterium]
MQNALSCLMLLSACASATTSTSERRPAPPTTEPAASRVRFMDSSGLLGCAWGASDTVIEQAMSRLGPALSRCADDAGTTQATWTLWVTIAVDGEVERASVPGADHFAVDSASRPSTCVTDALEGFVFESGPPSCGSALMLRFEVAESR